MSPNLLLTSAGPGMKFMPAMKTARKIWVEPAVRERHAKLYEIIKYTAEHLPSKWELCETTDDEFQARFTRANKQHRGCNFAAIVGKKSGKATPTRTSILPRSSLRSTAIAAALC